MQLKVTYRKCKYVALRQEVATVLYTIKGKTAWHSYDRMDVSREITETTKTTSGANSLRIIDCACTELAYITIAQDSAGVEREVILREVGTTS